MFAKRNILIMALLIAALGNIRSQDPVEKIYNDIAEQGVLEQSPLKFNTSLGYSYLFSPYFGAAMNMYAAPHLNYSATNRLSFHGGLLTSVTFPAGTMGVSEDQGTSSYYSLSAFVSASYQLSDNLIVYGTGVKRMFASPGFLNQSNSGFDDLSIGAAYRIGNFTIGASFHKSDYNYLNNQSIFGPGLYGSPFFW